MLLTLTWLLLLTLQLRYRLALRSKAERSFA